MNKRALAKNYGRLAAPMGTTLEENPLFRGEGSSAGSSVGWLSHQECVIHGLLDRLDEASPVPVAWFSLTFVKCLKKRDLERRRAVRGASSCPFDTTELHV